MANIKVFLSHQKADSELAASIGHRLKISHSIDVYLDVIDSSLGKSGPDLADYIRAEMEKCTQLLAVVSMNTKESQWVPWEIGVATEKERPLASFVNPPTTVPEFLEKWPYLRTMADVDKYAQISRTTQSIAMDEARRGHTASVIGRSTFRQFHRSLKGALGQAI